MFLHYLTLALRNLAKYKVQNLICILGLAVGVLCFTICLYCTRYVLSVDECFSNKERIAHVRMVSKDDRTSFAGTCTAMVDELRSMNIPQLRSIVPIAYPREMTFNCSVSENLVLPYTLQSIETDGEFLDVFTPEIIAGTWESAVNMQNSIVISESAATRIFGSSPDALGKNLVLTHRIWSSPKSTPKNGGISYTVAAVMRDFPGNNSLIFMNSLDALRLNDSEGVINYVKRNPSAKENTTGTNTYVLLNEGFSGKDFREWLIKNDYSYKTLGMDAIVDATPLGVQESFYLIAFITGAIGILILSISLLNFFNFLVSVFYNKTREFSLRKVYGGEFWHLFRQLYVQAAIVVLVSCLLMLSIIEIIGGSLSLTIDIIELNFLVSKRILVAHALQYTAMLLGVCALICLVVTIRLYKISVYTGIRKKVVSNKVVGRNIMLWWQIFICWIFLGLVGGLYMQSRKSSGIMFSELPKDTKSSIVSVNLNYSFVNEEWKRVMIDKFSKHSSVQEMLLTDGSLCEGFSGNSRIFWEGDENDYEKWFDVLLLTVPDNFFSFMNIDIEQGDMFETSDQVIVDRRFQQNCGEEVVGKVFSMSNSPYTVKGLCETYTYSLYDSDGAGFVFVPRKEKDYIGHCYLKCTPGDAGKVRKYVDDILGKELPATIDYRSTTLMEDIYAVQVIEYSLRKVFVFFALVCILITLLGVYSSISMDTAKRVKEVAIMKVNGAQGRHIAWKFTRLYAILLVSSAMVAFPLLYVIFHFWRMMYVQFFNCGPVFWISLFMVLAVLVGITIFWKVSAIVKINPARIIQQE